jgi:hypothetical protein
LPRLDYFLDQVNDDTWHNLTDLSKKLNIPERRLALLSKLLSETNIIEYEPKENKVLLKKEWSNLLKKTEEQEDLKRPALGTVVLPPRKTIYLQKIQITNLTEKELELGFRVNKELEEIAISTMK